MHYERARSLADAREAVASGAIPLAGGTVLVPRIAREGSADTYIDLAPVAELRPLEERGDVVWLGSMVRLARLGADPVIAQRFPALVQAARAVGNPQVRRAGTVGGNAASGLAAADLAPPLLALGAEIEWADGSTEPYQGAAQFTAAKLLCGFRLRAVEGTRSAFRKFAWRRASGVTIVSVAGAVRLAGGVVIEARFALGGVAGAPVRLTQAEAVLVGHPYDENRREATCAAAGELPLQPPAPYSSALIRVGVRRVLQEILES